MMGSAAFKNNRQAAALPFSSINTLIGASRRATIRTNNQERLHF
jgi:hypothetical protein